MSTPALDLLHCAALAAVAFAIGWPLGAAKRTPLLIACLLALLFTPSALIARAAPALLFSALLALKLAPLAALMRSAFPPPLTPEASHCAKLLPLGAAERARFAMRAAGPLPWVTFSLLLVLAALELLCVA